MKTKAIISGVAAYVPDHILTNKDFEKMVDTSDEWITTRTGIKKRHILKDPDKATSDLGAEAARALLKKTNTHPEEIDMIMVATVTADYPFPDTANIIGHKIGAKKAFGYDINAACSGFIYTLVTASKFIETGTYKKIIVIGADMMSSIVDYEDRTTCILFGDAGGAVLLEPGTENGIIDAVLGADGSGADYLYCKAGGSRHPASHETVQNREHFAYQEGRVVFKAAVKGMSDCIEDVMAKNGLTSEDVQWIVPHQANKRILHAVANYLDVSTDKVLINIENYGNTTAATIPLCLRDFEHKFKKGDNIILTAFGGGFTWGAIYLKWAI